MKGRECLPPVAAGLDSEGAITNSCDGRIADHGLVLGQAGTDVIGV